MANDQNAAKSPRDANPWIWRIMTIGAVILANGVSGAWVVSDSSRRIEQNDKRITVLENSTVNKESFNEVKQDLREIKQDLKEMNRQQQRAASK